jgi:osmotically-inducible protein OsmY
MLMNRSPRTHLPSTLNARDPISLTSGADDSTLDAARWRRRVRQELAGLPYYGVFDLITFDVTGFGLATLGGCVASRPLKDDAEKVVKRVEGIVGVVDRIEALPVSTGDDDLRRSVYRALYHAPGLSHYATRANPFVPARPRYSGWGYDDHDRAVGRGPRWAGTPFSGLEPVGAYPIHIIVKSGRVTLVGVVESHADKNFAGMKARSGQGAYRVVNDLWVASPEN